MTDEMSRLLEAAKAKFAAAGVKNIKIELEATVEPRLPGMGEYVTCPRCDGTAQDPARYHDGACLKCSGRGTVYLGVEGDACTNPECTNGMVAVPCHYCNGQGEVLEDDGGDYVDCDACDGVGVTDDTDEICSECDGYMRTVSDEEGHSEYLSYFEAVFKCRLEDRLAREEREAIKYCMPVQDVSVGTEITVTVDVLHLEILPDLVALFCDTCTESGNDPRLQERAIRTAGMHMALLWSDKYPVTRKLPRRRLENMKAALDRLKFALVLLGSDAVNTRSLLFRRIVESSDSIESTGNHLIDYHAGTCVEFRVFDTCYEDPDRILENVVLMAKSLSWFDEKPPIPVGLEPNSVVTRTTSPRNTPFGIPIKEFFMRREVDSLKKQLPYLATGDLVSNRTKRIADEVANGWLG